MPKLILINPVGQRSGLLMSRVSRFAPLGLAYVAALTPPHWTVEIKDENFDSFKFSEADLVGLTAFTSNITRAYEIAQIYRDHGIKVVLGGIHASMMPEEALQYVDTVVRGEAEKIWAQVIQDFEEDRLQRIYHGPHIDMAETRVRPRRDLLHSDYLWQSVQTSRGCPFNCHFCSVTRYLGRDYRKRAVEDVLDELSQIKGRYIAFVDDNLIGNKSEDKARAKNLFRGMISRGLNKRWWMQTSINAAEDENLIELAAAAGCMFVFIGFETMDINTLKKMRKGINIKLGVENYRQVVRRFHRRGIAVLGAFIIGNDNESLPFFQKLARFLLASHIDIFQLTLLTPLPGTDFMDQLYKENRILYQDYPLDWNRYRFSYIVHQTKGITSEEIYAGNNYIKKKLYSFPFYQLRLLRSFLHLKQLPNFYVVYKLNQAFKKGWKNAHYYKNK